MLVKYSTSIKKSKEPSYITKVGKSVSSSGFSDKHPTFTIKYDKIPQIIEELNSDDFEIQMSASKYNL